MSSGNKFGLLKRVLRAIGLSQQSTDDVVDTEETLENISLKIRDEFPQLTTMLVGFLGVGEDTDMRDFVNGNSEGVRIALENIEGLINSNYSDEEIANFLRWTHVPWTLDEDGTSWPDFAGRENLRYLEKWMRTELNGE